MPDFEISLPLAKVNAPLGVVFGWSAVSLVKGEPYVDFQGDWIPEDALLEATLDFAEKSRAAKVEHAGPQLGTIPFIFPLTTDIKSDLGLTGDYSGTPIGFKPYDKAMLSRFAPGGDLKGFSMGGRRILDEVVDRASGKSLGFIKSDEIRESLGKSLTEETFGSAYEATYDLLAKMAGLARNKLRRVMRKFEITEYSGVTEPAQEPAKSGLIKHRLMATDIHKVAFPGEGHESVVTPQEPHPMADDAAKLNDEITKLKAAVATAEQRSTDLGSQVATLQKQLARATSVAQLATADHEHYAWLGDDASREAFLGKSRADRDADMKAAIIHTSPDGTTYRRGEEKLVKAIKAHEETIAELAKSKSATDDAELAKAVSTDMANLPEKQEVRAIVLKAIRKIDKAEDRTAALAFLKSVDTGYATLLKNRGVGGGNPDNEGDVINKVNALAKTLRTADPKLSTEQAVAKVWEDNPELYAEYERQQREARN